MKRFMEARVNFTVSGHRLEGLLGEGQSRAVVVTHPHPLYGGDMHNPVVETIVETFQRLDYTTLRFNFRGAGNSQGGFDEGHGEQEDVRQAIAYLRDQGFAPIALSGYSFGTWVNAHYAARSLSPINMTMVSPPVAFMDFSQLRQMAGLTFTVTGSRDDIAPPEMLRRVLPLWNPTARLEIIAGADHFYAHHLDALSHSLEAALHSHVQMDREDSGGVATS